MKITIGNNEFNCVTELNAKREVRRTDINYNTQGDMLIDLVRRKYCLEVTFGLLSESEMTALRSLCENIFVEVGFNSPEGFIERDFHVINEPAPVVTTVDGIKMYGGVKLVFKEK